MAHDPLQRRRDVARSFRELRRLFLQDRCDEAGLAPPAERPLAANQLVQDDPEREDVDSRVGFLTFDLLKSGALVPVLPDYQAPEFEIVASIRIAGT